jgi:hypothetical protein
MGMFDSVTSEIPLPDGFAGELQTKDFACALLTLLIRADGRLLERITKFVEIPENERPPTKSPLEAFRTSRRIVDLGWRDTDFHGDLSLVGCGDADEQHFYIARFTHGTLEWIKNVNEKEFMERR